MTPPHRDVKTIERELEEPEDQTVEPGLEAPSKQQDEEPDEPQDDDTQIVVDIDHLEADWEEKYPDGTSRRLRIKCGRKRVGLKFKLGIVLAAVILVGTLVFRPDLLESVMKVLRLLTRSG